MHRMNPMYRFNHFSKVETTATEFGTNLGKTLQVLSLGFLDEDINKSP